MRKEQELAMYSALQRQTPTEEHAKRLERKVKFVLEGMNQISLMKSVLKEQDEFLLSMECNALAQKLVEYKGPYDVVVIEAVIKKFPLDASLLLAREAKNKHLAFLAKEQADKIFDHYSEEVEYKEEDLIADKITHRQKKRHFKVSEDSILTIKKFIQNYFLPNESNPKLLEQDKITHDDLKEYAVEHHLPLRRVRFEAFEKELVYNGTFLVVKDEIGQKIPYLNPLLEERERLLKGVTSKKLESSLDREEDFTISSPTTFPDIILEEMKVTEKKNRANKQFQYSKKLKPKGEMKR